ncbi:MAG TPA: hypothetical protein VHS13_02840 [Edaphobacter sp.]|jgi:hypothetical protein|nr:hypothetical protein [Edaphobacter sp.]
MLRVAGSIWAGAGDWAGRQELGSRKIRDAARILWKNNFNLAIAAFPVTRHVVIAELHVIEF